MNSKFGVIICAIVFIAGCATTRGTATKKEAKEAKSAEATEVAATPVAASEQPAEQITTMSAEQTMQSTAVEANKPVRNITNKELQRALKVAGYYNGSIDGHVGKNTRHAIKEFQKANDLKVDGIVGRNTRALLIKYLEK